MIIIKKSRWANHSSSYSDESSQDHLWRLSTLPAWEAISLAAHGVGYTQVKGRVVFREGETRLPIADGRFDIREMNSSAFGRCFVVR